MISLVLLLLISDNATEASARFQRGLELYEKGQVREALEQFLVSYRLSKTPNIAFNIGTCFESLENFNAAFSFYSAYVDSDLPEAQKQEGRAALAGIIPKVSRLTVRTVPPGASVFLDREDLGQHGTTPRTFAAPQGRHQVILRLPGYLPQKVDVELVKGELRVIDVSLKKKKGRIEITTIPPAAEVRIDGAVAGTSPLTALIPYGLHEVSVLLRGHVGASKSVEVQAGSEPTLSFVLEPMPVKTGRLRVLSNVATALVTVDGNEAGFTPLVLEIEAGRRKLTVHRPGFLPWTGEAHIAPDRLFAAEVTLEPVNQSPDQGVWPWVLLSASAAAGVTAIGLSIEAVRNRVDFPDDPTRSRYDRTTSLNIAADVMWIVTLISGAATTAMFIFQDAPEKRTSSGNIAEVDRLIAPTP